MAAVINGTTGISYPTWTTAGRPTSPVLGQTGYNTTIDALETYSSAGWATITVGAPVLNTVTGYIFATVTSTLTLYGSNFGNSAGTVTFTSGTTVATAASTPINSTSCSVVVPTAIYGLAPAATVSITFANAYGQLSPNNLTTSVVGLPTGGTVTTSGSYRIHTFTTSGNFISGAGFVLPTDWLIVGGGGGGGWDVGGGGGAGGYLYQPAQSTVGSTTYPIVIGSGGSGSGASGGTAGNGNNTTAKGFTAVGGGGGGNYGGSGSSGASGGSGGGGSGYGATTFGGPGTAGQGYAGGDSVPSYNANATGGGGGGGGGVGAPSANNGGGYANGGAGVANSITATSVTYATGGKGGGDNWSGHQSGAANTGNGGDGAGNPNVGASGGSGIVVVRYQIT